MMITHKNPTVKLHIKADALVDTRISVDEWNAATDDERGELVSEHCAFNSDVAILTPEAVTDGVLTTKSSQPIALGAGELTRLSMALNDMNNEALVLCGMVIAFGDSAKDCPELKRLWERLLVIGREIGL